ncbi:nitroreductase family deazaflavin-dependent oxidoreductase [Cumulibacter soli]|uniref:nitroreductase family deazaflavin-dependent oxidoreductase n=1 Tax=Cumulibacter soli TaxID=2546344 RepID=UPI0010678997|nr:nitroreductase family deazaflavin-dependent oxidoreductase [Cumulibacter soli]
MASFTDALAARLLQTRPFVRAPIWLFRHGFGRLLGPRLVMLEHTGRTSGRPRYVCLEVVERPSASSLIVVSGFGARAQWYRNLRTNPECRISSGPLRDQRATARFLPDDEADSILARYQHNHPKAWERLRGAIEHAVGHSVRGLPMVELSWETTR